jgi:hypothetical protein
MPLLIADADPRRMKPSLSLAIPRSPIALTGRALGDISARSLKDLLTGELANSAR